MPVVSFFRFILYSKMEQLTSAELIPMSRNWKPNKTLLQCAARWKLHNSSQSNLAKDIRQTHVHSSASPVQTASVTSSTHPCLVTHHTTHLQDVDINLTKCLRCLTVNDRDLKSTILYHCYTKLTTVEPWLKVPQGFRWKSSRWKRV